MAGIEVLIVVPARGGSKGLPRKNARELGDLPLLGWTAQAIAASALGGSCVILSTDDEEIAAIGRRVGLEVPYLRPADLATDTATAEAVALSVLDWAEAERGLRPDALAWLQPTSPFRPPQCLDAAFALMSQAGVPGVIGVKPLYRSLRALFHADDGLALKPVSAAADPGGARRQEVAPLYTPNGALYLIATDVLRRDRTFFPPGLRGVVMDQIASIDIDDPVDWALAEAVAARGLTWRSGKPVSPV